jgi:hypothetical protein
MSELQFLVDQAFTSPHATARGFIEAISDEAPIGVQTEALNQYLDHLRTTSVSDTMPLEQIAETALAQLQIHSAIINPVTECLIRHITSLDDEEELSFTDTDVEIDDPTDIDELPNEDDVDESDFGSNDCDRDTD